MNRRTALFASALSLPVLSGMGCGYVLYPERRGRAGGRIDPGIAVMDALWLLLFLIPGIVAFVVDFSSGAIYLGGHARNDQRPEGQRMIVLEAGPNPSRARVEAVVGLHLGRRISLDDPRVQSRRLGSHEEIQPSLARR
jgi:hypothetical protein